MRIKSLFTLFLVAVVCILIAYFTLFEPKPELDPSTGFETGNTITIFDTLKESYEKYSELNEVDYDAQEDEYKQLGSKLNFVNDEIKVLKAQLKNIESEHAQKEDQLRKDKTDELNKKANELRAKITDLENKIDTEKGNAPEQEKHLVSSSDLIYSLLLKGVEHTTSEIVTFVGANGDKGLYTVKLVGYIDSLSEALDNITTYLAPYDVSIGNCSFRQVYSCYNNMRPWDRVTLLKWFENNYVTGSGSTGSVSGGFVVDGIRVSGVLGDDTIQILEDCKLRDIENTKLEYQKLLELIEKERVDAIIAAYKGLDQSKVNSLINALNEYYDAKIAATQLELAGKLEQIAKDYDYRIESLTNPPATGDATLANPDILIYTLDITFSVYDE